MKQRSRLIRTAPSAFALPREVHPHRKPARPRMRRVFAHPRGLAIPALGEGHDLRDGRFVLEFVHPSIDLMVYTGEDRSIAEWITEHGALIALAVVGEA